MGVRGRLPHSNCLGCLLGPLVQAASLLVVAPLRKTTLDIFSCRRIWISERPTIYLYLEHPKQSLSEPKIYLSTTFYTKAAEYLVVRPQSSSEKVLTESFVRWAKA